MGDFLPWVPIGTFSGGITKSPHMRAGRVLGAESAPEVQVSHEHKQTRRALLDKAREERRKVHQERRAARRLSQQQAKAGEATESERSLRGTAAADAHADAAENVQNGH